MIVNMLEVPRIPKLIVGEYNGFVPTVDPERNIYTYRVSGNEVKIGTEIAMTLRDSGYESIVLQSPGNLTAFRAPHRVVVCRSEFSASEFAAILDKSCSLLATTRGCVIVIETTDVTS